MVNFFLCGQIQTFNMIHEIETYTKRYNEIIQILNTSIYYQTSLQRLDMRFTIHKILRS